ncbi:MAG: anaerobic sulfite reductase subunit AsrB, partial [bacterium]
METLSLMTANIYKPVVADILGVHRETAIDWTYRLGWNGDAPEPGQFFQVSVPRVGEAPISASGRGDGWVELTIRNVGRVTNAIFAMGVGDRLHLRGPY